MLARLSVFAGGWTLDLAEEVVSGDGLDRAAVLDVLASLVAKTLVAVEEQERSMRFRLLQSIGEYAHELLERATGSDAQTTRARHRDALLALVERLEPDLLGPDHALHRRILTSEEGNLTKAVAHAARTDPDRALRLVIALTR